jgi:ubiquinone/menaquinone biosynthesis C-methylase UbiE
MSITAPSGLSVRLHEFFWLTLMKSYYREYVESMALSGMEKVLDFGCGPGSASRFIAPILEAGGGALVCLDISETWIKRARRHLGRFPSVEFHVGDIQDWKARENHFDVVTIHFSLHDIKAAQRPEVAGTLACKMKTDARLFIREPSKPGHGMQREEIRELLENVGLLEENAETLKRRLMPPMYSGVFRKQAPIAPSER